MKLAIAVLALLCIGAHAHGIPSVSIEKTNEGVKSPEVTVKLPAVTVPVPKINVSMPEIRLPKISMPGQGKNINLQVPTVDVQGLLNAALNKPMPSINMTNLAALLSKPAMPSLNLDLSGLLSKPSVNISALAGMIPKPSIDLSGLQVRAGWHCSCFRWCCYVCAVDIFCSSGCVLAAVSCNRVLGDAGSTSREAQLACLQDSQQHCLHSAQLPVLCNSMTAAIPAVVISWLSWTSLCMLLLKCCCLHPTRMPCPRLLALCRASCNRSHTHMQLCHPCLTQGHDMRAVHTHSA